MRETNELGQDLTAIIRTHIIIKIYRHFCKRESGVLSRPTSTCSEEFFRKTFFSEFSTCFQTLR